MIICLVSHHSGLYGAEGSLLELIAALKKQDIECCVLVPYQGPLLTELRQRGITAARISYKWWVDRNPTLTRRILKTVLNSVMTLFVGWKIKQWKCDLVYTNTITISVGAWASILLGLPHVWHIHEFGKEDHGLYFDLGDWLSYWIIDKCSSRVICNSNAVKEKHQKYIPRDKLNVIYQSVTVPAIREQEKQRHTNKNRLRCAIVGRLQPGKRQEDAVRALGELRWMGLDIDLTIIGDGDAEYEHYLRDITVQQHVEELVHFTGYIKDAYSYLHSMDVVLICSEHEAFGRVSVEAMLAGKPVVGARSGGTVELVQEGMNGLLYKACDHKDLAEKLAYLYRNRSVATQMGQRGRTWAKDRFTQERYGREVACLLKCLAEPKKAEKGK